MLTFISQTFPTLVMFACITDNIHVTRVQNFTLSRIWPKSKPTKGLSYINIYLLFQFPLKLFSTELLVFFEWKFNVCSSTV